LQGEVVFFSMSKLHEKREMATNFDEHFFGKWSGLILTLMLVAKAQIERELC